MSIEYVNFNLASDFVKRAFRAASKARGRRIVGQTNATIHSLAMIADESKNTPDIQSLKDSLCKEALIRVYSALGRSYREINDFEKAIDSYREALTLDPENEFIWYGVAGLYSHIKASHPNLQIAKDFETYAQEMVASPTAALLGSGIAYQKAENDTKALDCWKKILQSDPNNKSARFLIAKMYYISGQDPLACRFLLPIIQSSYSPESIALYLAAAGPDDPLLPIIRSQLPQDINSLEVLAKSFERDYRRIWNMQQLMRAETTLSDGNYRTVWAVANKMGLHPRPINTDATVGATHIRRSP